MGLGGLFLRKTEAKNFKRLKDCIVSTIDSLGYAYDLWNEDLNGKDYCSISVNEYLGSNKGFVMWLYEEMDSLTSLFDWIDSNLERIVIIESISDCEDMILKILHEYFKVYPDDYFYDELDWFYTKEDIDRIYASDDWKDWCFKNPNS